MKVVFLGTPEFAVPSLIALAEDSEIDLKLVITQPDRPGGRGRKLQAPPVKLTATELGLPLLQPESIRDLTTLDLIRDVEPDVLVVVAYGEFLPRSVLDVAPGGAINVHPSLLPKYRGAAPVQEAIRHGDALSGVSIIRLTPKMDAGPILAQRQVKVEPDDTTGSLMERLAEVAAEMLPSVTRDWIAGRIEPVPQDDDLATYTREWTRDDARIDWARDADEIERLIRAAQPWPVAWTTHEDGDLRIHAAAVVTVDDQPAQGVVEKRGKQILVGTGAGAMRLLEVQPAGRRAMDAFSWWNGLQRGRVELV